MTLDEAREVMAEFNKAIEGRARCLNDKDGVYKESYINSTLEFMIAFHPDVAREIRYYTDELNRVTALNDEAVK